MKPCVQSRVCCGLRWRWGEQGHNIKVKNKNPGKEKEHTGWGRNMDALRGGGLTHDCVPGGI